MRASLNGLEVDAMNWNAIYGMSKVDTKTKKRRPLILQEVNLEELDLNA